MAEDAQSFSPIRMTAPTEEAAVQQALQIAGLERDQVQVEVLRQDAKGVTVRIGPRRDDETPSTVETSTSASGQNDVASESETGEAETSDAQANDSVSAADAATDAFEEDIISTPPLDTPAIDDAVSDDAPASAFSSELAPHEYSSREESSMASVESNAAPVEIDLATQERARAMAQDFLDRMGMEAEVEITPSANGGSDGGRLHLNIEGEDVGILIGKHGQTLQAFQYLLNVSLNNRPDEAQSEGAPGESPREGSGREGSLRVVVDAGGYRSRRSQSLEQVARDAASRAKRDRRSVRLEPMPAYERRLVHLALQEDATVATTSEGRDPLRHVVVSPAGMRPTPSGGFNDRAPRSGGFGGNRNRGGLNANRGAGGNRPTY